MKIEVVCSSRELFGADRSAMRLAEVLGALAEDVRLVVPAQRPDLGLDAEAGRRGIAVEVRPVAIASSRGVEAPRALLARRRDRPDLTVHNTTAVLGAGGAGRKVLMVREWLEPSSVRHRAVAALHRRGLTAVVGISTDVLTQWRACIRGPRVQELVPNWLEDEAIPAAPTDRPRAGIVFLGRFNDWKGQDVLADAYEQAFGALSAAERPPLTFVGAQPGTVFAGAAEQLERRGVDGGWTVAPFADDPAPFLDRAALLVLPSLHPEPFGMVLLEALAHGCCVLAFPGGGADDLAGPFAHALTTVPRTTADLAAGLRAWWAEGGPAQSAPAWAQTLELLRTGWSPAGAQAHWARVLAAVA